VREEKRWGEGFQKKKEKKNQEGFGREESLREKNHSIAHHREETVLSYFIYGLRGEGREGTEKS